MKKSSKILLTIVLISILLLSIIGTSNVYADEKIFSITSVDVIEKSETTELIELDLKDTTINSTIIYHKIGDYAKYKINIKNNSDKDYKIKEIADNNKNECISYEYEDYSNTQIKAKESKELIVTVKYLKENTYIENRIQELDVAIDVTIEDEEGNIVTEPISINPKTGDSIIKYVIILLIAVIALFATTVLSRKNKIGKNRNKHFGIIIAMVLVTPAVVDAAENLLNFNFKSTLALMDKYVLTYTNASGEKENEIVEYGKTVEVPVALEKEGYTFIGWYDENNKKIEGKIENVTEDIDLIPKWEANTYEIKFDPNNGIGTMENQSIIYDAEDILTANVFTKKGYTFKNWNTKADGTGTIYEDKAIIKNLAKSGTVTLYAQWSAITYKIAYNLNGGTLETANPTTYTVDTATFTLNNPSKKGYYFTGWTGSNGNTVQETVTITKGSTEDRTYTANFAQYTKADLRPYDGSNTVWWTFNDEDGTYTITQQHNTTGWGQGVICDNSSTDIEWEKNYMLEFEIYVPTTCQLLTDANAMFPSKPGGDNDIYGTTSLVIDGVNFGTLSGEGHELTGGSWHKVKMYLTNDNEGKNKGHLPIRSFSGFGLYLKYVDTNYEYKMRNLKSIVY